MREADTESRKGSGMAPTMEYAQMRTFIAEMLTALIAKDNDEREAASRAFESLSNGDTSIDSFLSSQSGGGDVLQVAVTRGPIGAGTSQFEMRASLGRRDRASSERGSDAGNRGISSMKYGDGESGAATRKYGVTQPTGDYMLVLEKKAHRQRSQGVGPHALAPCDLFHVHHISGAPHGALESALEAVYAPMMSSGGKRDAGFAALSSKLQSAIAGRDMERGTWSAEERSRDTPASRSLEDECALWQGVASDGGNGAHREAARKAASCLESIARGFAYRGRGGDVHDEEVFEHIESCRDELESLWAIELESGFAFPQRRMEHVLSLLAQRLVDDLQTRLMAADVWQAQDARIPRHVIALSVRAVARLEELMYELTGELGWAAVSAAATAGRRWEGAAFESYELSTLRRRLMLSARLIDSHDGLMRLLEPEELHAFASSASTTSFSSIARTGDVASGCGASPIMNTSADARAAFFSSFSPSSLDPRLVSDEGFQSSVDAFNVGIQPVEERVAHKLKLLLDTRFIPQLRDATEGDGSGGAAARPHQLFGEMKRFYHLFQRPVVKGVLRDELMTVERAIAAYVANLKDRVDQRATMLARQEAGVAGQGAIDTLAWCRHIRDKLSSAKTAYIYIHGETVDGDRESGGVTSSMSSVSSSRGIEAGGRGPPLPSFLVDSFRELVELENETLARWQQGVLRRIDSIRLERGSQLVSIDRKDGRVRLLYNDGLSQLVREVRQLGSMGIELDASICKEVASARRMYHYGMLLNQVSAFYNNIESQMIPSQKAMMLGDAREFESLLMHPVDSLGKAITWEDRNTLDDYISKLERVSARLTDKNRRLRRLHSQLAANIVRLMDVDLVRQKEAFGQGVRDIRELFRDLDAQGGIPLASQRTWRVHWDFQLYKALEHQYARGLEVLNESLPRVSMSLIFKQRRLIFDPPIEEVRASHYKAIRQFVSIPLMLKGVSEQSERSGFFKSIVETNIQRVLKLYDKTEQLFGRLLEERRKMNDWVCVGVCGAPGSGTESIEEMIRSVSPEWSAEDWEANIRRIKLAGREALKIPDTIYIDCFTVSLVPVKEAIDVQHRSLHDAILAALRDGIADDRRAVSEFVAAGEKLLRAEAGSIEEIGRARSSAKRLVREMDSVQSLFAKISERNRLLRVLAGSGAVALAGGGGDDAAGAVDVTALQENWDAFTRELQQHERHLEGQKDTLKQKIIDRAQQLTPQLEGIADRWRQFKPGGAGKDASPPSGDMDLALRPLRDMRLRLDDLEAETAAVREDSDHFDMTVDELEAVTAAAAELRADMDATEAAWSSYIAFSKEVAELADREWIDMRRSLFVVEDFVRRWQAQASASESTSSSATTSSPAGKSAASTQRAPEPVRLLILDQVDAFRRILPHLKYMSGYGWEGVHWSLLFSMLGVPTRGAEAVTLDTLTLRHFFERADRVVAHAEEIRELCRRADGEAVMRDALSQLKAWKLERCFTLVKHASAGNEATPSATGRGSNKAAEGGGRKERASHELAPGSSSSSSQRRVPVSLISVWTEVMSEVCDHQSLVSSLQDSPYYGNFRDEVLAWEQRLERLSERLSQLNSVQRKWVYLEPILSRGALPQEQARFRRVDTEFRRIMAGIETDPCVCALAETGRPELTRLPSLESELDLCQRALSDFLEDKRSEFSRFYFIGDEDLLEVLGRGASPAVMHAHLKKLFAGIDSVDAYDDPDGGGQYISAMRSATGETVALSTPLSAPHGSSAEVWLRELEVSMRHTLAASLSSSLRDEALNIEAYPGQILCLSELVSFTAEVERAISKNALGAMQKSLRAKLAEYTRGQRHQPAGTQHKLRNLILDLIHERDVLEQLIEGRTSSCDDWAWFKQLRYYCVKPKKGNASTNKASGDASGCAVAMASARFEYSFEYLGGVAKLVYTPLTDKCYLTLTQGMALGYGGNPYGPAGTGKTESVKALGQCLGRQVLVFNCDETFDYRSMGRIFTGLVMCGAWGCFDEFNRLEEEVLSAVSSQIQTIQDALKEKNAELVLMGRTVKVNKSSAVFVTLNPAGRGYGGRSKLPDNLKQLFRSIAMSRPDNELIAEVMLLSDGYVHARRLGKKLVALFTLAEQLLSKQQHYDWGLRALKVVLTVAGELKHQQSGGGQDATGPATDARASDESVRDEAALVVLAARDATKPKLAMEDDALFDELLADIFSGVQAAGLTDAEGLGDAVRNAMADMGLEASDAQAAKVMQLHGACAQRIGVILVGPPGSGKSTLWKVLRAAYARLSRDAEPTVHCINPKAVPRTQLLGNLDMDTREFTDGILTAAARKAAREPPERTSWILCDGDIDPEWVESLNSVLDDNRLLTLPNGERIQFGSNVNFIFETHSLAFASPATVSRCGMIYLSDDPLALKAAARSLLSAQIAAAADKAPWASTVVSDAIDHVMAKLEADAGSVPVPTSRMGLLRSACSHVEAVLAAGGTEREAAHGVALGLGANLHPSLRDELAAVVADRSGQQRVDGTYQRVYDAWLSEQHDADGGCENEEENHSSSYTMSTSALAFDSLVVVPQVKTAVSYIAPWLTQHAPFILAGPSGSGKRTLLLNCIEQMAGASVASVCCNAQTTANDIISKLIQACGQPVNSRGGLTLQPARGKLVLYLQDVNLPRVDKYSSSQVNGFLHQLLSYGGFYYAGATGTGSGNDTNGGPEFVSVKNLHVIGSMCPSSSSSAAVTKGSDRNGQSKSGGGRSCTNLVGAAGQTLRSAHPLSTRLTTETRIAYTDTPPRAELETVYQTFFTRALAKTRSWSDAGLSASDVSRAMVDVYEGVTRLFSASSPGQSHYAFTPRHVTEWMRALRRYHVDVSSAPATECLAYEAANVFRSCLVGEASRAEFDAVLDAAMRGLGAPPPRFVQTKVFSTYAVSDASGASSSSGGGGGDGSGNDGSSDTKRTGGTKDEHEENKADGSVPGVGCMDLSSYRSHVASKLMQYEREVCELHIELFDEVLRRIASLERALSRDSGAVLLLGRSGVGRRSSVLLATYMLHMEVSSPKVGRGYDMHAFRAEFRGIVTRCAVEEMRVCLLIEEHQLATGAQAILDDVSSILTSGEVSGLFAASDMEAMTTALKARQVNVNGQAALSQYIKTQLARNLRIAVILDPTTKGFADRMASQPALLSHCHAVHVDDWNAEEMERVCGALLSKELDVNGMDQHGSSGREQDVDNVLNQQSAAMFKLVQSKDFLANFGALHGDASEHCGGNAGVCPRHLVRMVQCFGNILKTKSERARRQARHLGLGLDKLHEASSRVDALSREAERQRQLLAEKRREAELALSAITESMSRANESRNEMGNLQRRLGDEELDLQKRRDGVEAELSKVRPLVEEAQKAVGQIRKDNLNELRSMKSPPDAIRDVLEGVLLLMGQADTSWVSMKKFLGQVGVKDQIINYDARRITDEIRASVEALLQQKKKSFDASVIHRVSLAAAPLAGWVKANLQYSRALEAVRPLEQSLMKLVDSLKTSKERVAECEAELASLDSRVVELKQEFAGRTGEAEQLKLSLGNVTGQLQAAEVLIGKLGGERARWKDQLEAMQESANRIPNHAMLASAASTYLCAEPEEARRSAIERWSRILGIDIAVNEFSLRSFMTTESETLEWRARGLPGDDLSIENAVAMLDDGDAVPYVMDPSSRALTWLERQLGEAGMGPTSPSMSSAPTATGTAARPIERVTMQDPRLLKTLELAVRFGKTLIIEEVDEIPPVLVPLLRRDLVVAGSRSLVSIGDRSVDISDSFRLFLFTRSPSPRLSSHAASLVRLVSFTSTRAALLGQLLALTMAHEKPELEAKRGELLRREEALATELRALQESLLTELAQSEGDILENTALVSRLNETQASAATAAESLQEAARLQRAVDVERGQYRPVAATGAELFFLLKDLRSMNHMYQFSLKSFLELYALALEVPENPHSAAASMSTPTAAIARGGSAYDERAAARVAHLTRALTELVYEYAAAALFHDDRPALGVHISRRLIGDAFGTNDEWVALTNAQTAVVEDDHASRQANLGSEPAPAWVPTEYHGALRRLMRQCPHAASQLGLGESGAWSRWLGISTPEESYPDCARSSSPLMRLAILGIVRPDRISAGVASAVRVALGIRSVTPEAFTSSRVLAARPLTPLLLVTTAGADPSSELREMATACSASLVSVPMGQGQAEVALERLEACSRRGDWLLLTNLHLVISWLDVLEKAVYRLEHPHEDFRLILTTEAHDRFPASLLNSCTKVAVEAPPGLRQNVQRSFMSLRRAAAKPPSNLGFLLCWFHALLQERRTYIPQGWSKLYEFGFADLRSGSDVLTLAAETRRFDSEKDWQYLHGVLESAVYGGRVDAATDVAVLRAYIRQTFSGRDVRELPGTRVAVPGSGASEAAFDAAIRSLPEIDSPAMFGLPANIGAAVQRAALSRLRRGVTSLEVGDMLSRENEESQTSSASAGQVIGWADKLRPLLSAWEDEKRSPATAALLRDASIAGDSSTHDRQKERRRLKAATPAHRCVVMERNAIKALLRCIDDCLASLGSALVSSSAPTGAAEKAGASLIMGAVPDEWVDAWDGPMDPLDFLSAASSRAARNSEWERLAERGELLGIPDAATASSRPQLSLGDLIDPLAFLSAIRQQAAREHGCSVDALSLQSTWLHPDDVAARGAAQLGTNVILLSGLLIQGATFGFAGSTPRLEDVHVDSPPMTRTPHVALSWQPIGSSSTPGDSIRVPCYANQSRRRLLMDVQIPCTGRDADKWSLAGLAVFAL